MHTFIKGTFAAVAMLAVASCSRPGEARMEALPCAADTLTGDFITPDGSVIDLGLDGQRISPLVNGYFTASTLDGVTVYRYLGAKDGNAEIEVVKGLSGLRSAGCMSYGVIPVARPGGHIELVDEDGLTVATLTLEHGEVTGCDPYFTEGLMRITTDEGKVGLVDPSGKMVIEPRCAAIGLPSDGRMIALTEIETDGTVTQHYSVIDCSGKELYAFPESETPVNMNITDGRVAVRTASGFAFADIRAGGELLPLPAGIKGVEEMAGGMAVVNGGRGKKGLVSTDGKMLLDMQYNQVRVSRNGAVAYCRGTRWYVSGKATGVYHEVAGAAIVTPVPLQSGKKGFDFVARGAAGYSLVGVNGAKVGDAAMMIIECGDPQLSVVNTDYPRATTTVELPGEEEWTED